MALARCMQTDTLWNKKDVSLGSRVTVESRLPNSRRKLRPSLFTGPRVSTAIGTKSWTMFEHRGTFRRCTWSECGDWTMGYCQRVGIRNVPCNPSTHFPKNQRHSVWSLLVVQEQTGWLLGCRDPGSDARTEDYVVQHIVSARAPSTPPTRQSMNAQSIHRRPTGTVVWSTQIHAKPQAN